MVAGGVEKLPRKYGPGEGTPPNPTLSAGATASPTASDPSSRLAVISSRQDQMRKRGGAVPLVPRCSCGSSTIQRAERWMGVGGCLRGPVSSGELFNAANQHLVAGHEWPSGMRLSVVRGGSPPPPAAGR